MSFMVIAVAKGDKADKVVSVEFGEAWIDVDYVGQDWRNAGFAVEFYADKLYGEELPCWQKLTPAQVSAFCFDDED